MCKNCGTFLGPMVEVAKLMDDSKILRTKSTCRLCGINSDVGNVEIPYIFKFLISQLGAVNINVKMTNSNV